MTILSVTILTIFVNTAFAEHPLPLEWPLTSGGTQSICNNVFHR